MQMRIWSVYDRTNSKGHHVCRPSIRYRTGKKTFIHTLITKALFPKADNWMILADYNGDGLKDLFTPAPRWVSHWHRQVKAGSTWSFADEQSR